MRVPAALFALVFAVGCTSSHSTPRTTAPSPSATASPTASNAPAATGAVQLLDTTFVPTGGFRSPSGNVQCQISADDVLCDVLVHTWPAPEPQDGCTKAYATAVIGGDGQAALRSDCYLVNDTTPPVLAYGAGLQLGDLRCVSEPTGVTCLDVTTRQGFTVSRTLGQLSPRRSVLTDEPAVPTAAFPLGFQLAFASPTGNLDCLFYGTQIGCLVGEHDWKPEPYDEAADGPCEFDRATTVGLVAGQAGRAYTDCRSDANGGTGSLAYGSSVQVGTIRCTSARTGLTCTSGKHGFEVSRQRFRGF